MKFFNKYIEDYLLTKKLHELGFNSSGLRIPWVKKDGEIFLNKDEVNYDFFMYRGIIYSEALIWLMQNISIFCNKELSLEITVDGVHLTDKYLSLTDLHSITKYLTSKVPKNKKYRISNEENNNRNDYLSKLIHDSSERR